MNTINSEPVWDFEEEAYTPATFIKEMLGAFWSVVRPWLFGAMLVGVALVLSTSS